MPNQTDELRRVHARLRESGQRLTPQRLLILELLHAGGDHLTADDLFAAARRRYPYLNISTVYRTLELLRDVGVLAETDLGGGRRHFALLSDDRHHHLICLSCGAVDDVEDEMFDTLRAQLLAARGFAARIDHLALFGACRLCAGSALESG